jgi:16S rRNA (guanine966-N2)-methyltransferase
MRVIAGSARGHHLKPPPSSATRPTADKIKGALFAMLESLCGLEGMRVLDLYAGTGALAIEALSRGAEHADLVEDNRQVCAVIRENLAHTRTNERATVLCMSVRTVFSAPYFTQGQSYDIILLDPPYADPGIGRVMETLAASTLVADETVVVLEHAKRFAVPEAYGRLRLLKTRVHGDTGLSIFVTASRPAAVAADTTDEEQGQRGEDSDLPGQL